MEQFSNDLQANETNIFRTYRLIEVEFHHVLDSALIAIDHMAQKLATQGKNQETDEAFRQASNKLRQQKAQFDSELAQLLNVMDHGSSSSYLSSLFN